MTERLLLNMAFVGIVLLAISQILICNVMYSQTAKVTKLEAQVKTLQGKP